MKRNGPGSNSLFALGIKEEYLVRIKPDKHLLALNKADAAKDNRANVGIHAVAVGELLIDFTFISADEAGYPTMAAHPDGAPANYLAALSSYGASPALLGKVGDDAFGKMLCLRFSIPRHLTDFYG